MAKKTISECPDLLELLKHNADWSNRSYEEYKLPIHWYIQQSDMTQKEIAEKININPGQFNHMLNPASKQPRPLHFHTIEDICKALNTSLLSILSAYNDALTHTSSGAIDKLKTCRSESTSNRPENGALSDKSADSAMSIDTFGYEREFLIDNISHDSVNSLLGRHYCYFVDTNTDNRSFSVLNDVPDSFEYEETYHELRELFTTDSVYCGILDIYTKRSLNGIALASFSYLCVEDNEKQIYSIRTYKGRVTVSPLRNVVYLNLEDDGNGLLMDVCIDTGFKEENTHSAMALALIHSTKRRHQRPCMQRMIITDTRVLPGTPSYQTLTANLMLNDKTIRIDATKYQELLDELDTFYDQDLAEIIRTQFPTLDAYCKYGATINLYASIPETAIAEIRREYNKSKKNKEEGKTFERAQATALENLLRLHSLAPWYNKTKDTKADKIIDD